MARPSLSSPARLASTVPKKPYGLNWLVPVLSLLIFFFLVPLTGLLLRSVSDPDWGLQNYRELVGTVTYVKVMGNTFLVASVVTVITVLVGFPVAWLLAIIPSQAARLLMNILLLSMWTNLLVRTYAWMVLLQQTGFINKMLMASGLIETPLIMVNNLVGVTIGMTYIMVPFLVMPLHATMKAIDPSILRAAAICGASQWQAFYRVLLPLAAPGLASGALMVFVMSLGYFVTPALLGGTANMMLAELIAQLVQSLLNWGLAGAVALMLMVVTLGLYALQLRLLSAQSSVRASTK